LTTLSKGLGNLIPLTEIDLEVLGRQHYRVILNLQFFNRDLFVGILQLDNITQGTWKPHTFEEDLVGEMFELHNITRGIWKPHIFQEYLVAKMFELDNIT
jgi:hypothetical protein